MWSYNYLRVSRVRNVSRVRSPVWEQHIHIVKYSIVYVVYSIVKWEALCLSEFLY